MSSLYYYTARTKSGKFVHGSLSAASDHLALGSLRTRSLFVTSLQRSGTASASVAATLQGRGVARKHVVALYRSLATLVHAGVPMRRALDVTIEQCKAPRLQEALRAVRADIEGGLELSSAMARRPAEFPQYIISMLRAGEAGGVLDEVLERVAALMERDNAVRKRIQSAAAYPAVVGCTALALVVFLMTTIVPTFNSLYQQMHVPVPGITRVLIATGTFISTNLIGCAAIAIVFFTVTAIAIACYRKQAAELIQSAFLRLPILATLLRNDELGRLSRLLGTLLQSGVAFADALPLVVSALSIPAYCSAIEATRHALGAGQSLGEVLARSGTFDAIFIQLVRVGEETGALDAMLMRLASYYDVEVEAALSALASIIEPLMIMVVGGLVGGIVAAIFIPLYTLVGNIR